jgi:LmbE family N-acetylglucosaminyl deacetylase
MSWQADRKSSWEQLAIALVADPPDVSLRIAVLAAHPDDETIGASVLLARFPQSTVVYLTDGAPQDERFWTGGQYSSRQEYAARRHTEATDALAHAGVLDKQIFSLGAVDQEAVFEIPELIHRFANLLKETGPDVVITHPYEGGHPDHDSAALIAQHAISLLDRKPQLVEMTSYHAESDKCVTGKFLNPQTHADSRPSAPAPATLTFAFSAKDNERKRKMFDAYASQRLVLKDFPADRESLRAAPDYDFSHPPRDGKLWYECMGWPMTGARWRELAAAAIAELGERSCR